MRPTKPFTAAVLALTTGLAPITYARDFDIVILNGRVMDPETNFDKVANVGINNGWITEITTEDITGKEAVDATDHVVAPGFIDTHTHSSNKFSIKMSMMDGVTTGLDLEVGALNIAAWYEREAGKWPINYGQAVSQELVRMIVHDGLKINEPVDAQQVFALRAQAAEKDGVEGWSVNVSTLEQINEITKILDENLRQGALGVGSTIGYAKTGISTYEMFEAQRAAARYGRLTAAHTRFHTSASVGQEATLGFAEVFTNACLLKTPLLICHDNDYGWWEIEEKLKMAREMGMNMWAEYYPYAAGSTSIGAEQLKPEAVKSLGLKYEDIMFDPSEDRYLTEEDYLKISREDSGRAVIVFNPPRVEWMKSWIRVPQMVVGSDAMWSDDPDQNWDTDPSEFSGHPRTSGSHSTVLRMGREADVPLMFTLAQLSYWSAVPLGKAGVEAMDVRGRLQEGMVADIVIFDPKTVKAGSSYKKGEQGLPPIGMPHVIVNGVFVKRNNEATNKFPGQPIRYAEETDSRHVPASQKQWLKSFTIDSSPVAPKPVTNKKSAAAESTEPDPDHTPMLTWFGDRPYRSMGYCCEWHRNLSSVEPGDISLSENPYDPLFRLAPPAR